MPELPRLFLHTQAKRLTPWCEWNVHAAHASSRAYRQTWQALEQ